MNAIIGLIFGLYFGFVAGLIAEQHNEQKHRHPASTGPTREFVLDSLWKFYKGGCVDALEIVKKHVPNTSGDPTDFCAKRAEFVRKTVESQGSK